MKIEGETMRRTRSEATAVCVALGLWWAAAGCSIISAPAEAKAPDDPRAPPVSLKAAPDPRFRYQGTGDSTATGGSRYQGTGGAGGTGDAPGTGGATGAGASPASFDPFATPFAVVDSKDGDRCILRRDVDKWQFVPPIPPLRAGTSDLKPDPGSGPGPGPRVFGNGVTPYCVYKWLGKGTRLPSRRDFSVIGAVPDRAIIVGGNPITRVAPRLPEGVFRPLLKIFEQQAHGIEAGRWTGLLKEHVVRDQKKVRVAVIDATPLDLNHPDNSYHGFAVSRVIGTLLCGDVNRADCSSRVRPYLAMPMLNSTDADLAKGGYFGTFYQLADALGNALADWNPKTDHLVINLSLGWDPIRLDHDDKNQQRVLRLLESASCMGALVVAAAGNPTGTDGAVYPGRFEELAAPSEQTCRCLKIPGRATADACEARPANIAAAEQYAPLVHSVGALDNRDRRFISNRRWGQPRLAALGMFVTVPGPGQMRFTPPFSGTSMSTAIVSGVAAAVWSVRPELSASEAMALVYKGGVSLDGATHSNRARTEFCEDEHYGPCEGPLRKVHRIYLCGAMAEALKQSPGAAKLHCSPEVSTATPVWPSIPPTAVAKGSCRVANCGLPLGPTYDPTLAEDVAPHGGFAECPGCSVTISGGVASLIGTPSRPDNLDKGLTPVLAVLITGQAGDDKVHAFDPGPAWDTQMNVSNMEKPSIPEGATLTFSYKRGISTERTDPTFDVPLYK